MVVELRNRACMLPSQEELQVYYSRQDTEFLLELAGEDLTDNARIALDRALRERGIMNVSENFRDLPSSQINDKSILPGLQLFFAVIAIFALGVFFISLFYNNFGIAFAISLLISAVLVVTSLIKRGFKNYRPTLSCQDSGVNYPGKERPNNLIQVQYGQRRGSSKISFLPVISGLLVYILTVVLFYRIIEPTVCVDGWPSPSIGKQGACSWHKGVAINWSSIFVELISLFMGMGAGLIIALERGHLIIQKFNVSLKFKKVFDRVFIIFAFAISLILAPSLKHFLRFKDEFVILEGLDFNYFWIHPYIPVFTISFVLILLIFHLLRLLVLIFVSSAK